MLRGKGQVRTQDLGYQAERYDPVLRYTPGIFGHKHVLTTGQDPEKICFFKKQAVCT